MVKISQEHIKAWLVPLPPLVEQQAIVAQLGQELGAIESMSSATERTVDLLQERRSALIAEAVTGQLDVGSTA
jgi:type I restriction enzyme S subunit